MQAGQALSVLAARLAAAAAVQLTPTQLQRRGVTESGTR